MRGEGVRLAIRCIPRGGADQIEGVVDGRLRVRVAAPAVDGEANDALLRLLADELGLPRSAVRLVAGQTGRNKTVAIEGIDVVDLVARWPDLAV
jgi:uncharacterized protein (TIGR00251 family)